MRDCLYETWIVVLDGHTLNPGDNPWDGVERLGELMVYDRRALALVDRHRFSEPGNAVLDAGLQEGASCGSLRRSLSSRAFHGSHSEE